MPLVIHHNDNDGFCSALIAKQALGEAEFFETNYGAPPPDVKGRNVYILDFSYPRDVLEQMHSEAESLVVIDHHKTAQADLAGLDYAKFDMEHSGCQLTRQYFNAPSNWLVDYVEDRDLWKWQLENSREINAAIASYDKTFDEWEKLWKRDPQELVTEGFAIERYKKQVVNAVCASAEEHEIGGYKVPVVNAPFLQSEIGEALAKGQPFAGVYIQRLDGSRTFSLRTQRDDIDVSAIAKQYGGGGHRKAAGFKIASGASTC